MTPSVRHFIFRIWKTIYFTIAGIIIGVGLWLACAYLLPLLKVNADRVTPAEGIEIFIKSNGVHTDFVLPARSVYADWKKIFPTHTFEHVDSASTHLAFGWGDKGFYLETETWGDLKFSTAFKAAFWLSTSAMHLTYYRYEPSVNDRCKKLVLTSDEYKRLIDYILASFEYKNGNAILIHHPGYGDDDNFYEAVGRYNFIKTCNEWTGDGLDYAGLPVGIWTPIESGIIGPLK